MDPSADWNSLVAALDVKNWYAVVAIGMMLAIQFFRKHPATKDTWAKIPEGWRFLPAVIASFSLAFVKAFVLKEPWNMAVLAGIGGIAGIAVPAMGLAAALKESPLPWDGGAGGKALAFALMLLFCPMTLTSCAGMQQGDRAALIIKAEHLGYNSAVAVLDVAERLDVNATDVRKARYARIQAALTIAQAAIAAQNHEPASEAIGEALELLGLCLDEAKADGVAIPETIIVLVEDAARLFPTTVAAS